MRTHKSQKWFENWLPVCCFHCESLTSVKSAGSICLKFTQKLYLKIEYMYEMDKKMYFQLTPFCWKSQNRSSKFIKQTRYDDDFHVFNNENRPSCWGWAEFGRGYFEPHILRNLPASTAWLILKNFEPKCARQKVYSGL